jgi:hypothetical protein
MAKRRRGARAATPSDIEAAMSIGRERAEAAVARRARAARTRSAALKRAAPTGARRRGRGPAAAPRTTAGVLVAEGDSWFDYPWADVLQLLEDAYAYDVESVAHKGDRVEDMAYAAGQLDAFTRQIEKLSRRGVAPRAILLSGGGNDVAGDEFAVLLNHANSASRGLSPDVLRGVVDDRIRLAYVTILTAVTTACEQQLGRRLPILLHGYDYAVPDGRGFFGGFWVLPGPWLEPGFRAKGYGDAAERLRLVAELIDRFNEMLRGVVALPGFEHVQHIDLRRTLSNEAGTYRRDWANELHPTRRGWELVAAKFARALDALP